jgi:aminoglycoside phosphotransferase (APT) family kinase protein
MTSSTCDPVLTREPDLDPAALEALGRRVFGTDVPVSFQRTPEGLAAQVYRVTRGRETFYLRLAEDPADNLETDAEVHRRLIALGVRVPDVVFVTAYDEVIGRSVMVTTAVPGVPLAQVAARSGGRSVLRAAGADLARLHQVPVDGYGWVARDGAGPLRAEFATYADFLASGLPVPWPGPLATVFSAATIEAIESLILDERDQPERPATLAHGDVRLGHIFAQRGSYTGLIDLGEVHGANPAFDLGRFLLTAHDVLGAPPLPALLEGYREVAPLPDDHLAAIRRSAIVHGLPELVEWLDPDRRIPPTHPVVATRISRITELVARPVG